eukprot:TRINITY_DN1157_c0_g1_i2.p2 TRINITY_DN1157_c0_g1~~TRINITY_DN1157_c0_g1_i2.p2  ORF type:complete len:314 (+),score=-2.62 TRINITY_DN1157_c0_g1_i2:1098-2039(+)
MDFMGQNAADEAVRYFNSLNYVCPYDTNPAEYFMKILSVENFLKLEDGPEALELASKRYEEAIIEMVRSYEDPGNLLKCMKWVILYVGNTEDADSNRTLLTEQKLAELKYVAPWGTQFWHLLKRATTNNIRSPLATITRFCVIMFLMVVGLGLYYDVMTNSTINRWERRGTRQQETEYPRSSTQQQYFTWSLSKTLFQFVILIMIVTDLLLVPEERAVLLRDQASSLYDMSAYFMSKIISVLPITLIIPVIVLLMSYWWWNFNDLYWYNFWICRKFFFSSFFQLQPWSWSIWHQPDTEWLWVQWFLSVTRSQI